MSKNMTRKPNSKSNDQKGKGEDLRSSNSQLVFISHDTRDAELAEAFSNLLRNASAGALKSFRSSDKKGNQGIEYGQEWYPALMTNLQTASAVVCLLTQHSVDRPWVLFETGVAKGKLDTPVTGLALGIPLNDAIKGPFAVFQNNEGSTDSITKLVFDLVAKVPGLDPDIAMVKPHVESFVKQVEAIVQKQAKPGATNSKETDEATNVNTVVKLFEEVKIMFEDLPTKVENRIDPELRRRRVRIHPMMLDEMMHMTKSRNGKLPLLMVLSLFRKDFPWVYEIGQETMQVVFGRASKKEKELAIRDFMEVLEFSGHHPMMREMGFGSKENDMLLHHSHRMFERYFQRYLTGSSE